MGASSGEACQRILSDLSCAGRVGCIIFNRLVDIYLSLGNMKRATTTTSAFISGSAGCHIKSTFPLHQTEAQQHERHKDVASDVHLSCSCCHFLLADSCKRDSSFLFSGALRTVLLPLVQGLCAVFRPLSTAPRLPASQFTVCTSRFTRL